MGVDIDTLRLRWRQGALDDALRVQVSRALRQGLDDLRTGRADAARQALHRAHGLAQNDPLRHAASHLCLGVLAAREGRPGATLAELRLAGMAVPASVVRRAAGLRPGQDNGPGLWSTWRDRHTLRAASRPRRASDLEQD